MTTHLKEGVARAAAPPVAPSLVRLYPDFQEQAGQVAASLTRSCQAEMRQTEQGRNA